MQLTSQDGRDDMPASTAETNAADTEVQLPTTTSELDSVSHPSPNKDLGLISRHLGPSHLSARRSYNYCVVQGGESCSSKSVEMFDRGWHRYKGHMLLTMRTGSLMVINR